MADINLYFPKVKKWEGGYVNHPNDRGGPTKYGVTLATAQRFKLDKNKDGKVDRQDVKLLTEADALYVLRQGYWGPIQADRIKTQLVAELLCDWYWMSQNAALTRIQRTLNKHFGYRLAETTTVKEELIQAINRVDQRKLYKALRDAHKEHFDAIVRANPSQKVFYKGWMNRLNRFPSYLDLVDVYRQNQWVLYILVPMVLLFVFLRYRSRLLPLLSQFKTSVQAIPQAITS